MTNRREVCYLCRGPLSFAFYSTDYITSQPFSVHRCDVCSLQQTLPRLTTSELALFYRDIYYKKRKSVTDQYINRARVRRIASIAAPGRRIVDIGCGNGALVEMLMAEGWDAYGTEVAPPEHFVNDAVTERIYLGEFDQAPFLHKPFDIATFWHVFEHLPDPRSYLKILRQSQKPGGALIIEVPNIDSWQAQLYPQRWFNLDVPRHAFHFTPKSLTRLLAEEGYTVTHISHYSAVYSLYGWVQSLLNLVTRRSNILFDLLNNKISLKNYNAHGITWWELALTLLLAAPATVVALPLTLLETFWKKGGIITVYATRSLS